MSDEIKLKPCPFCGGEADLCESDPRGEWSVWCPKCHCGTTIFESEAEAEAAWNRRVDASPALSTPPRNCDVGTAEEQSQRMHTFCVKYGLYKGFSDNYKCDNCPLLYTLMDGTRCELAWAQMPYESEASDGSK